MFNTEISERRCDWCYPADLYRVDRRFYEWALGLLDLHPYVCCICGGRGLMIGRSYAYNWRRRRVRIRIVFRVALGGSQLQRLIRQLRTVQREAGGSASIRDSGIMKGVISNGSLSRADKSETGLA